MGNLIKLSSVNNTTKNGHKWHFAIRKHVKQYILPPFNSRTYYFESVTQICTYFSDTDFQLPI